MNADYKIDIATFQKAVEIMFDELISNSTLANRKFKHNGADIHIDYKFFGFSDEALADLLAEGDKWLLHAIKLDEDEIYFSFHGDQEAMLEWLVEWSLQVG